MISIQTLIKLHKSLINYVLILDEANNSNFNDANKPIPIRILCLIKVYLYSVVPNQMHWNEEIQSLKVRFFISYKSPIVWVVSNKVEW